MLCNNSVCIAYVTDVALGVIVTAYIQVAFWLMAANRQAQKIRVALFGSIMRQEIGWFDTHDAGELNTRLVEYVTSCTSRAVHICPTTSIINLVICYRGFGFIASNF